MAEIAKLDKNERYYHRTDEQLIQFAELLKKNGIKVIDVKDL